MSTTATTPAPSTADLAAADYETRAAALREAWTGTGQLLKDAESALARALWDKGTAGVLRSRTAYAAGVLGSRTTTATAKGAARVLEIPDSTASLWFKAGKALAEAGKAESVLAPTEEEIAIVAAVLEPINKASNESKGKGKGKGESTPPAPAENVPAAPAKKDDPVIMADVIAAVENLQVVMGRFTRDHGFPAVVAENLTATLEEIIASMDSHTIDGGNS